MLGQEVSQRHEVHKAFETELVDDALAQSSRGYGSFLCQVPSPLSLVLCRAGYLQPMRYFVIGTNGELYGPADIATLQQWIGQGRLLPTSMIKEELGGAQFAASMLKELNFGMGHPQMVPYGAQLDGHQEVKTAWIMGVLGILCCSFCGPIGLVYAIVAKRKGNPNATAPLVFCAAVTILSIVWTIFFYKMGGIEGMMKALL